MLLSPESVKEMRVQHFEEYRKAYNDGRQQSIISIKKAIFGPRPSMTYEVIPVSTILSATISNPFR